MRWLLVLLLLNPVAAASIELDSVTMRADLEEWQDQPQDLGISLEVRINATGTPDGAQYSAQLDDGFTQISGSNVADTWFRFDVNGDAETPALVGTNWNLEVTVRDAQSVVHRDTLSVQVNDMSNQGVWADLPIETSLIPTSTIPFHAGAAPSINVASADSWRILTTPNTEVAVETYKATFQPLNQGVSWFRQEIRRPTTDDTGAVQIPLPEPTGFYALSASGDKAAVWQLYSSSPYFAIDNITPPAPTTSGPMQFSLNAPQSGQLFATNDAGGRVIGQGALVNGMGFMDGSSIRSERVSSYRALAFFTDPTGTYLGHLSQALGVAASLEVPTLGVDEPATISYTLAGSGPAAPVEVTLLGDEEVLGSRTVWLRQNASGSFIWTPQDAGATTLQLVVDRGDLLHTEQATVTVLDADAFADAQKSWYHPDRLLPLPWFLPALALLAVVVHKRKIRS